MLCSIHRFPGDPKTLTPGPWTPLRTRSMDYLTDRSTDPFYGPPPTPFCWAQPPAFTITNSTQASGKTTRLLSSLVAAIITFILLFLWAIHIYLHLKQIANISIFLSLGEMWRCVKYWTVMR